MSLWGFHTYWFKITTKELQDEQPLYLDEEPVLHYSIISRRVTHSLNFAFEISSAVTTNEGKTSPIRARGPTGRQMGTARVAGKRGVGLYKMLFGW